MKVIQTTMTINNQNYKKEKIYITEDMIFRYLVKIILFQ